VGGTPQAARRAPAITMYSTAVCPYCIQAERLLRAKGATAITKIRVDLDPRERQAMMARTGRRTVPQIYIGERHVGGYDDLVALERAGELDPLLAEAPAAAPASEPPVG
jgi:glutaredoxin 3